MISYKKPQYLYNMPLLFNLVYRCNVTLFQHPSVFVNSYNGTIWSYTADIRRYILHQNTYVLLGMASERKPAFQLNH